MLVFSRKHRANLMRLYLHSARCPVALRSFLDCNPNYWCFIPLSWQDAITANIAFLRSRRTLSSSSSSTSNILVADPDLANIVALGAIDDERVARYLDYIPPPPAPYVFSYRQRQQQRLFFEQLLSTPIQRQPYSVVDLYQMKIIAVRK